MLNIADQITQIKKELPPHVQLVAVSKTKSEASIMEAYLAGQRIFGENKVQELVSKYQHLPKDIEWHFIGHLQSNKVKLIAPFISLIHGVDSIKLLEVIAQAARREQRVINCLIQLHIAQEESKFGFEIDELKDYFKKNNPQNYLNLRICGLMGMATNTRNEQQVKKEFASLQMTFETLKQNFFLHADHFSIRSMGMSGDYLWAIEEGSTMVRVGSTIFGNRTQPIQ